MELTKCTTVHLRAEFGPGYGLLKKKDKTEIRVVRVQFLSCVYS